jgi:hypothetical protein
MGNNALSKAAKGRSGEDEGDERALASVCMGNGRPKNDVSIVVTISMD